MKNTEKNENPASALRKTYKRNTRIDTPARTQIKRKNQYPMLGIQEAKTQLDKNPGAAFGSPLQFALQNEASLLQLPNVVNMTRVLVSLGRKLDNQSRLVFSIAAVSTARKKIPTPRACSLSGSNALLVWRYTSARLVS